ncbi:GNAT family N-acetyltransferase [Thermoflavifilum thermophilum]|uniref:Predicted N-acetyltransferase YhbS n=1 Tax=Thermoflavifilum thermophilum TaxID=1393122 RepID=A0A1I7N6Q5_9BACT|nr:GNAT family N-acetyltransferase [Thermoflavifilum thermophilum]SFV30339.1 Predicted N-acetyltransferase YhbS [Thermoflavifilum thermophilum]
MDIQYAVNQIPVVEEIIDVYVSSGIRRPVEDLQRISKMYRYANLVITARHGGQLVGVARSLTDFCYSCYLSDLAVRKEYQRQGIGKKLIELTLQEIGEQSMLLLLAAPEAMDYYPHLGFMRVENGFLIPRKK